jgi:hypothetical protein
MHTMRIKSHGIETRWIVSHWISLIEYQSKSIMTKNKSNIQLVEILLVRIQYRIFELHSYILHNLHMSKG